MTPRHASKSEPGLDAPLCGDETCTNYACTQRALDAHMARVEQDARDIVRAALGPPNNDAQEG